MKHLLKSVAVAALISLPPVAVAAEQVIAEKPVRIVTSSDPSMFPERWQTKRVSASGTSVPGEEFERVRMVIGSAIRKYPSTVLRRDLEAVCVLSELKFFGVSAGGTNSSSDTVYLNFGNEQKRHSDAQNEALFHAEFSSILLRNHPAAFDAEAWQRINPPGFQYLGNGVDAVRQQKAGQEPSEELERQGFLVQYSQSSVENDFNDLAAPLLSGDAALWEQAERFPKLKEKLALTVAFYHKLNPTFTEAYFCSLVKR